MTCNDGTLSVAFSYDPIGNRIATTNYTETGSAIVSEYAANNLNQYTSRTVPGVAAVRGFADVDATVTVNENPTWRLGEYFYGSDAFDNSYTEGSDPFTLTLVPNNYRYNSNAGTETLVYDSEYYSAPVWNRFGGHL